MAKDEQGASSSNGASPDGFIDEQDRLEVEAQHARFREVLEELEAEGVDFNEEYEKVRAKAASWSSAPS